MTKIDGMTNRARPLKAAYHHGNLRAELLRAASGLLETDGLDGLTLRAAARAAGVSHAAPRHHFGDLSGLLSDLAAEGFRAMRIELEAASQGSIGRSPRSQLEALGYAYVAFAVAHPAMFLLMYRNERLDTDRPALREEMTRVRGILTGGATGQRDEGSEQQYSRSVRGRVLRAWTSVHGFALLLLDGRLAVAMAGIPGGDWRDLLGEMFDPDLKRGRESNGEALAGPPSGPSKGRAPAKSTRTVKARVTAPRAAPTTTGRSKT